MVRVNIDCQFYITEWMACIYACACMYNLWEMQSVDYLVNYAKCYTSWMTMLDGKVIDGRSARQDTMVPHTSKDVF